jgi:hypothetical protein
VGKRIVFMKNLIIILILSISSSCNSQNSNWERLTDQIKNHPHTCENCFDKYTEKDVIQLFKVLNKDLNTTVFNELKFEKQVSLSFCEDKYEDKGYFDCIYVSKLRAPNAEIAEQVFSKLKEIPEKTIHYIKPKNWDWIIRKDIIYFVYSNTYHTESYEFSEVSSLVRTIM